MRDSSGEAAERFHLLRLPELILQLPAGGNVAGDALHADPVALVVERVHIQFERQPAPFTVHDLELEGGNGLAVEHPRELPSGEIGLVLRDQLGQVDAARIVRDIAR